MLNLMSSSAAIRLRAATPHDQSFIARVFRSARPDLQYIDGDTDLVESVIELQQRVLQQGAGEAHPNAMHFIAELHDSPAGVALVDFGHNEIHIIFLAMLPQLRGKGYGRTVLQSLQQAAWKVSTPLSVVVWQSNQAALQLYLALGFVVAEHSVMANKLVWYPERDPALPPAPAVAIS